MKKNIISIVIALVIVIVCAVAIKDYMQEEKYDRLIDEAEQIVYTELSNIDYCADLCDLTMNRGGSIKIKEIKQWGIKFDIVDEEGSLIIPNAYVETDCRALYNDWNS